MILNKVNLNQIVIFPIIVIDNNSIKKLNSIINDVLFNPNFKGLILFIEKNDFNLDKLDFLKDILINFYVKKKKLGLWGLPYCVTHKILGGFDYTRFSDFLLKESFLFDIVKENKYNSCLMRNCFKCIIVNNCFGVGNLIINQKQYFWQAKNEYRFKVKNYVFFEKNILIIYNDFLKHISNFSLEKTDRTITYAKSFSVKIGYKYKSRFIYFCNFLSLGELLLEEKFLKKQSENKDFVLFLFEIYPFYLKRYAFSLAYGEKNRETFYLFFQDKQKSNQFFINYFKNKTNIFKFENFWRSVGIDFINKEISGYKIYSDVINIDLFLRYIKTTFNFGFKNELIKDFYNYVFVRRYDKNWNLISVKIEIYTKNYEKTKNLVKKSLNIELEDIKGLFPAIIAFDLDLQGNINKITTYYWYLKL